MELAWLKVQNEENLLDDITETLNKYQRIYDDLIESMNKRQNDESGRKGRCDLLTAQINELKGEVQVDVQHKEQMRKIISKDEEARNAVNRELQKVAKQLATHDQNIRQMENDMSETSEW